MPLFLSKFTYLIKNNHIVLIYQFQNGNDWQRQSMDYYEILGCDPNADIAEIKKCYQKLALKYHPDKDRTNETNDMYLKIDEAWKVLRDPEKRRIYDAEIYESKINEQSNTFAELNTRTDFSENEAGVLLYPCRCGDFYEIDKSDIENEKEFIIECNQCSLVVKVRNDTHD